MYYPKSQIQTGFYSNGELVEKNTLQSYTGPYFTTSDNKAYTGKEPNDGPNSELIILDNTNLKSPPRQSFEEGDELGNQDPRFLPPNLPYSKAINATRGKRLYSPIPYYPILVENEINNGEFIRYFAKKSNENVYTEISPDNFVASVGSRLYLTFTLPWVISGEKERVRQINANQIQLTERTLSINGLDQFLKYNYLQFYQG